MANNIPPKQPQAPRLTTSPLHEMLKQRPSMFNQVTAQQQQRTITDEESRKRTAYDIEVERQRKLSVSQLATALEEEAKLQQQQQKVEEEVESIPARVETDELIIDTPPTPTIPTPIPSVAPPLTNVDSVPVAEEEATIVTPPSMDAISAIATAGASMVSSSATSHPDDVPTIPERDASSIVQNDDLFFVKKAPTATDVDTTSQVDTPEAVDTPDFLDIENSPADEFKKTHEDSSFIEINEEDVVPDTDETSTTTIAPDSTMADIKQKLEDITLNDLDDSTDDKINANELAMAYHLRKRRVQIPGASIEQFADTYDKFSEVYANEYRELRKTYSQAETEEILNVKYANTKELLYEDQAFMNSGQQFNAMSLASALDKKQPIKRFIKEEDGTIFQDKYADKSVTNRFDAQQSVLSGNTALMFIAATTSGILHTYLPNSGFYVDLRGPKNTELDLLVKSVLTKEFEYGKLLGQYFFNPADNAIKQMIMTLLPSLVTKCNLQGWRTGDKLVSAVSVHDYDTILHAIAFLMHPHGVTLDFHCSNESCSKPIQYVKTDLRQIKFVNEALLTSTARKFLVGSSERTLEELKGYRDSLGFNREEHLFDNWYGDMQVPTMKEHIDYFNIFNAELAAHIQLDDAQQVEQYLGYSRNQFFAPWIEKLKYRTTEGKEIVIKEKDQLPEALSLLQDIPDKNLPFFDSCRAYIASTKIVHIGYPYDECPVCHTKNEGAVGGIIPCDVQSTFFYLSEMKLNSLRGL